jgi:hypothetical protein
MAQTKTTKQAHDAMPYVRRLLEDERVHDQLSEAATRLRKAYRRADRKKGAKAVEDKKVYAHVRGAAASLRGAALALQRKPPPKPKRRGRTVVLAVALAGVAVLLAKRASASTDDPNAASRPAEPAETAGRPAGPVEPVGRAGEPVEPGGTR